jgi:hypothetical protein
MSAALLSLPRRTAALAAIAALVASLLFAGFVAAPANSASHHYPAAQKKAFMKSCVPAAVKSASGSFTKAQATRYCASALSCIESKLSLKAFIKAAGAPATHDGKIVVKCEKQAAADALS